MKIIASLAISADGYTDDCSAERLVLSDKQDWAAVYRLRSEVDAILIGAETLRRDNPSLLIKDQELKDLRRSNGLAEDIVKVVVSSCADFDVNARFFTTGEAPKIVITGMCVSEAKVESLKGIATVIRLPEVTACAIKKALEKQGIKRLMVEGGVKTLKMFLDENQVDEFRLAVAPFKVEQQEAPCFGEFADYMNDNAPYLKLYLQQKVGQMTVCNFVSKDDYFMEMAISEGFKAEPSMSCYRVGAVIVSSEGDVFCGYTGENAPTNHAEEEALAKALAAGADLKGATIYSSMEPCSKRSSKPKSCSELIIENGFRRVLFAFEEPAHFVDCKGRENLLAHGIDVEVKSEFGKGVKKANEHVLG